MATKKTLRPVTTVTIILGMLILPVFPQDEPPPNAEATREALEEIVALEERAKQGHAPSQYVVGLMEDVAKNYSEAVRWFRAAAEQGFASAQESLGSMYYNGHGVSQDYKEAVRWSRAAAEQGHSGAQNNLGVKYDRGQGVPQDYIQAHMWFNLAASNLTGEDRESAATNRDSIAEKMTSEQIAEAQRLAREWQPKTGSQ